MKYSSRFFLYAPMALFMALTIFAMAHWWIAAGAFDKKLAAIKGREAMPGVTLDWSKVAISGFPFRIDAVFDGFTARGAGAHGPFLWRADHFALHALTYGRDKTVFEAAGRQSLVWTDASGAGHALDFLPASVRASAVRDTRGLTRFDLDIVGAGGKDFTAGRLQFHMRRNPDGKSLDLMASGDDVTAVRDIAFFGPRIRALRVYAGLTKGAAFAPLLRGRMTAAEADAIWRQAGGRLRIGKLQVESSHVSADVTSSQWQARLAPWLGALY